MNRTIGERQRWAWLAAGISAVASAKLCGMGWLTVLAGGLLAGLYYLYIDKRLAGDGLADRISSAFGFTGKVLTVFFLFWIVLVMGWCACLADAAFPMVDGFPGLGWVLLALAAWGCRRGPTACAGCAGIVCLFLVGLYGATVAFSVPNVKVEYLLPAIDLEQTVTALGLLLLPACVWCVPVREQKGKRTALLLLPAGAVLLSAITAGVLSPELAQASAVPVYELAQSVSVLGVVERIEPLLSAAMTMGIFCLLSAQAAACQALADQIGPWQWSGSVCCLAAAGTMYLAKMLPGRLLTYGNLVFFLLLPLAAALVQKKSEK